VARMHCEQRFGGRDWRLPNRREMRSLRSLPNKLPALPERHPFIDVFNGWYWTATTAAIGASLCRRAGYLLVVDNQPVRAGLGLGSVPGKRRDGRWTKALCKVFGMGSGDLRLSPDQCCLPRMNDTGTDAVRS